MRKRLKGSHVVGVQIGDLYRTYIECSHILVYIYLLNLCFTIYNKDYLSLMFLGNKIYIGIYIPEKLLGIDTLL